MKPIGIFGSSGFARETGDVACDLGYKPIYIVRTRAELDAWSLPMDVMLESEVQRRSREMPFAIGIGENAIRQKVAQQFIGTVAFANLLHPSASFGQGQRDAIEAQQGVIVCAGARFTNNIRIGDFTIFNLNITVGHDVIIEDFVNVAPGTCISGNVHVGTRCWLGTGSAINQGTGESKLRIGNDTVIGSGSVVVKDCDPNAVYVGIPAKRIK